MTNIKPDPTNARQHTPRNLGQIERSIQSNGFGRSILLANDGTIIAGNATFDAASSAGLDDVLVIETDGTKVIAVKRTDVEPGSPAFHRLAVSDNRAAELASWDAEVLRELAAADQIDLDEYFFEEEQRTLDLLASLGEPLTDPDDVPAVPDEPTTKPGDLWLLGRHRLLCGDATVVTDVDALMQGDTADLVWTDPPYGVGVGDKNKWLNAIGLLTSEPNRTTPRSNRVTRNLQNDTLDEDELLQLLRDAFSLAVTVCTAGAAWYVAAPPGPLHLLFGQALNELGIWRQTIIWVKDNSTFSPLGVTYHWQAEPIFYGWLPNGPHSDFTDRKQTTVWQVDRPSKSPEHPTMKPVELVLRSIAHTTKPGDVVIDMFGGSGTTMIAAEETDRAARLMELDPHYCDVIVQRWERFTGQTATLQAEAMAAD